MRVKDLGLVAVLSLSAMAGGCVIDDGDGTPTLPVDPGTPTVVPEPTGSSTRDHLVRPRTFKVQAGGTARVTATRLWGEDGVPSTPLAVVGGELVVQGIAA